MVLHSVPCSQCEVFSVYLSQKVIYLRRISVNLLTMEEEVLVS